MPAVFEELRAWQEARRLAGAVYRVTEGFPLKEQYGLVSQIRRASVSVMSNIAEGQGRYSRQEFIRFLYMARGSLMEVQSLCFLAGDLEMMPVADVISLTSQSDAIGKMLNSLIDANRLRLKKSASGKP